MRAGLIGFLALVMGVATGSVKAANDVLNVRMGPGTQYLAIDSVAPDARGLRQIPCMPLLIPQTYHPLTEAQRANLPERRCLMQSADFAKAGWVAQRFITEDTSQAIGQPTKGQATVPQAQSTGGSLIDGATRLVRDLYADFAAMTEQSNNPFAASNTQRYFFANLVPGLRGHGTDLLYGEQDFLGEIMRIVPGAQTPMLRGMITINVDYINFGEAGRATFRLRADTQQQGAPIRIFSIDNAAWTFP